MFLKQLQKFDFSVLPKWLILIVILGLLFRCINLDQKVYWVDEVATTLRISGYTQHQFVQEISEKPIITIPDLQQYQKPEKQGFQDALNALIQSPEHAPLYFILVRFWVQLFGNSVLITRSLSVILSLLALPCLYFLCLELFKTPKVGQIAVALLSVSPFYIAYAQEARPYSLWVVTILLSSLTLLRAIRLNNLQSWGLYTLTLSLGFHTSLLSILVWFSQTVYVFAIAKFKFIFGLEKKGEIIQPVDPPHPLLIKGRRIEIKYAIASSLAVLSFTPWMWIMIQHWEKLHDNTVWMRVPLDVLVMIPLWMYNTFIIFVETPVSLDASVIPRVILDFNLLILVAISLICLYRTTPEKTWLYVVSLMIFPPVTLILIDLIGGGQRSTAARYVIPYHIGIELAVAYFLSYQLNFNQFTNRTYQNFWKVIFTLILVIGICSSIYLVNTSPKYQKTRNLSNIPIAKIINQAESPVIITEKSQMLDILSLSYLLNPKTKIYEAEQFNFSTFLKPCKTLFIFNPSTSLQNQIKSQNALKLQQVYQPKLLIPSEIYLSLWRVESISNTCRR